MGFYLFRLECVRMVRDARYLALAVIAPIGFYLLFATLFGAAARPAGPLKGTVEIMVAMAAYGAVWGALSATGPRIAQERAGGWLEQVRAMPISARRLMAAKLGAAMVVVLPSVVLVCVTAALVKGVTLGVAQWAGVVGLMWVGALPFALMGVAIGYLVGPETAFPLSYGLYMAMSAMGGLWVPPSQLPASFQQVAQALPTYRLADLGWRIAQHQGPSGADGLVLGGWALGFAALAGLAYRGRVRGRGAVGEADEGAGGSAVVVGDRGGVAA